MSRLADARLWLIVLLPEVARVMADEPDPLAGLPRPIVRTQDRTLEPMRGRVIRFRSGVYGDDQPVAICATDLSDTPKPLIVDLIPGTLSRLERAATDCERICRIALAKGKACVAIRPCGRGNGSVFQGYGEIDALEAIAAVRDLVAIDAERISLTGASMGGAGTWYLASHYPDSFAAAAPFCGYCDYALWDKPGGTTFHRQPWEVFSWVSRGAAYRAGNLRHVALRITHGEWDRAVGGGVPVEHSRQMNRKLSGLGVPPVYVEVPKTGHGCRTPEQWEATLAWLLEQTRVADVDRISLVVHTLRYHRIRWLAIDQQVVYGKPSTADARRDRQIVIDTDNVRRLAVGPMPHAASIEIWLDGSNLGEFDLSREQPFVRSAGGQWSTVNRPVPIDQKRPGLSGPFGDLFIRPTIIVHGQSGSDTENHFNRLMAYDLRRFFNRTNGGVHRGGIPGDNQVPIPVVSDKQAIALEAGESLDDPPRRGAIRVNRTLLARSNLFLIGNADSNALLARLADDLPVAFEPNRITLGGRVYAGQNLALFAVLPHPDRKRYVGLLSGLTPDAICRGSHAGLQLLPDYLVFDQDRVVDWGLFDNDWRVQP